MSSQPYTYSFLDTLASISGPGGSIQLGSGTGNDEEGIVIEPQGEVNKMRVGADGSGMHSLIANFSSKVRVSLLKNSPTNQLLSAMVAFQRTSAANWGQNNISVVNKALGDTITCQQVAFSKIPKIEYTPDGHPVEWEFDAVLTNVALGSGPI